MGDPRVTERDNPLVRRLNAVAQINAEAGTALGGGMRPPRPSQGPVQGGSATVLPPPAVPLPMDENPLPPAEQAELERRWAEDPENPANRYRETAPTLAHVHTPVQVMFEPVPVLTPVTGQHYLSVIDKLPLTEEQKTQVKMWTFEGAAQKLMLDTAKRLDEMQEAFGLAPKKEEPSERGKQAKVEGAKPRSRSSKGTTVARRRKKPAVQGGTGA